MSSFEDKKLAVARKIISVLDESENVWEAVQTRQKILHKLYAEQIIVSDKFTEYNLSWRKVRNRAISNSNVRTIQRLVAIDIEVQILSLLLDNFEVKTTRAGGIIKEFIRKMKAHIASLQHALCTVDKKAKTEADLRRIFAPSLEWTLLIPDANIDELDDEWKLINLEPKITRCLEQLKMLAKDKTVS